MDDIEGDGVTSVSRSRNDAVPCEDAFDMNAHRFSGVFFCPRGSYREGDAHSTRDRDPHDDKLAEVVVFRVPFSSKANKVKRVLGNTLRKWWITRVG